MKKDKCASCGKQGELKADIHQSDAEINYRVMFCEECYEAGTGYLKKSPVYCPACGKKLSDEFDLHYLADADEPDFELASLMGVDEEKAWSDNRFSYVHDLLHCPSCGYSVQHGPRWYFNDATDNYDLPQPEGAPIAPSVVRQLAKEAGQLELFGEGQ